MSRVFLKLGKKYMVKKKITGLLSLFLVFDKNSKTDTL